MLQNIGDSNQDGFGVAWLDREDRVTRWRKGMQTAEETFEVTQTLPLPFLVHARMATAGVACPQLTHPFPVEHKPSLALAGKAHKVLAHNGHVFDWERIAHAAGIHLPKNAAGWSDTRVLAALVAKRGQRVLRAFQDKFALLSIQGGLQTIGQFHTPVGAEGILASSPTTRRFIWVRSPDSGWSRTLDDDEVAVRVPQVQRLHDEFDAHAEQTKRDEAFTRWIDTAAGYYGRD